MNQMQERQTAMSVILLDTCRKWYVYSSTSIFIGENKKMYQLKKNLISPEFFQTMFFRYNQGCIPSVIKSLRPNGNTVYGYATYVYIYIDNIVI